MNAHVTPAVASTRRTPHLCLLFLMGLLSLLTFSGTATAQCCGTSVPNGFFEEMKLPPVQGGLVNTYLSCWQSPSPDAVITTDHPFAGSPGLGSWKIAMRGTNQGGDALSDFAITTSWLPVKPGKSTACQDGSCARMRRTTSTWISTTARDRAETSRTGRPWPRRPASGSTGPSMSRSDPGPPRCRSAASATERTGGTPIVTA